MYIKAKQFNIICFIFFSLICPFLQITDYFLPHNPITAKRNEENHQKLKKAIYAKWNVLPQNRTKFEFVNWKSVQKAANNKMVYLGS